MERTRNAAVLLGLAAIFNLVGNVAFHVLAARKTNVSTYGLIATLLSLGFLASSIGAGLQYAVARHAAAPGRDPRGVLGRSLWSCLPILGAVGAATLLGSSVSGYLHATPKAIDATLLYFAVTIVSAIPVGVLMAQRRFGVLAATTFVGSGFRFLLALVMGLHSDPSVVALMTSCYATLLAATLNTGAVVLRRRSGTLAQYRHEPRGAVRAEGSRLAVLGACLWATWLLPISFARHFLSRAQAGHFSVGHLAGSSLLYLASPIATAYFPTIMKSKNRNAVVTGLLATAAVGLAGAVGLGLVGPLVFSGLFGVAFPPSHLLFLALGVSAAACSIGSYLLWTSRARQSIPRYIPIGVITALVVEILLGIEGPHAPYFLALSPVFALSVGALASAAFARVSPVVETTGEDTKPQAALSPALVAAQEALPAEPPSLLPYLAVGVMACNEELTIRQCMEALLGETQNGCQLGKVIVVASGSTDGTRAIVREMAETDRRITLVEEPSRTGKVNAINLYLDACDLPLAGLVNADVVLAPGALAMMTDRFRDPRTGMVGGRPQPQNDRKGLCNSLVHLEWELHDAVARRTPKLGEAVLFRRVFDRLGLLGTADEVAIEALLLDAGYQLCYVPEALVYNHGPTSMGDYVRHRRRIHGGHIIQQKWDGYTPATMRSSVVAVGVADAVRRDPGILRVLPLAIVTEVYIRATTVVTYRVSKKPVEMHWDPIASAKRPLPASAALVAAGHGSLSSRDLDIDHNGHGNSHLRLASNGLHSSAGNGNGTKGNGTKGNGTKGNGTKGNGTKGNGPKSGVAHGANGNSSHAGGNGDGNGNGHHAGDGDVLAPTTVVRTT
jgi:biofilm PGA synthesis N-glycosyltransferase PgaC